MKTILVITASPRVKGNCSMLADAFIKGAEQAGHHVQRFDAGRKTINGCLACEGCWKDEKACVQNDDFNELAQLLPRADAIVYVSPLYYSDVSAQLKSVIDRQYAFSSGQCAVSVKTTECMMMVCGETDDAGDFEGINKWYRNMLYYKGWKNAGTVYVTQVSEAGDIAGNPSLKKAERLGEKL